MTDLIYTHITAKVPGCEGQFLINPYGMRWDEITASSLVKIDVDGNKSDLTPYPVNPAGFTIHSAVHMSRPDAHWVMHTHTRAGVAVSCLEEGLLPLNQIALQFHGRVAYHEFEGIALSERERIIRDFKTARTDVTKSWAHGGRTQRGTDVQPNVLPEPGLRNSGKRVVDGPSDPGNPCRCLWPCCGPM